MPRLCPSTRIFASLLWTLPGAVMLPQVAHAQNAPREALIIMSRDVNLTLAVGSDDGAKIGQTYRLTRGAASAKIQITAVSKSQSTAMVIAADTGFVITVGDSATFLGEEPIAPPLRAIPGTSPGTPEPLPGLAPATGMATSATNAPAQAILTGVMGTTATLGVGIADGAVVGAVYALPLAGEVKARLQITAVRANDSTASVSILQEGFTPTVGDTTRFLGVEQVPVTAAPPVTIPVAPVFPSVPSVEVPGTTLNSNPLSSAPVTQNGIRVSAAPISSISGSTATVTSISGQNVSISAGSAQGAKSAQNVPILRGGEVIGLLRLQIVEQNSASGVVLYRDETLAPIAPGDAVGILGAAPSVGSPVVGGPILAENPTVAATVVQFETGASNFAVPKANPTYELLAALASSGLIRSQPASVFQDDGARRHNPSEDILFSRAQVAGFVREAMGNYDSENKGSGRDRAALAMLTKEFRRDLTSLGETEATLAPFATGGSAFGVSGFTRLTLAGGDTDADNRDPFSESYGARRSKSGYDSRTNIFGQIGSKLSFYSSFDYGNDIRKGNSNIFDVSAGTANSRDGIGNLQVRKAFLSYDAQSLLRGLTLSAGRREFWWGPGQFGTTTLSDAAGGLNSLSSVFERGSYKLEGLYAYLGHGPVGGARSLYGQNLSVKVGNSARFGVTTTILSPKDKFDPKLFLGAFTPISLYILDRQGGKTTGGANGSLGETNAVLGGYAELAVARGARVYGEIVLDDLAVNEKNPIENRNGSLVGAQIFNPKNPAKAGISAEYARLNSISNLVYLGNARDADSFYQYRGAPLGYAVSPASPTQFGGSESLRFEAHYMPLPHLRLHGGLEFADVNAEDQNAALNGARGFSRQQIYRFAAAYELSRTFTLTARLQKIDTNQPNFIKNEANRTDNFFSVELGRSF
ncbi:Capsule assembly protein Wzi [Abditibacterium utsteinense]|uniref:Capsule assembly protein Wzi n=1 Tax=Abditibacterium utsteinense TaxID=1960156 RepID=A0A2S8SX88_9BACT|nr:hypothetical protein [Abditibacterium utsteinense]PQV65421.1 Capsule assembly protein Wzi [Abditibacterium utsteinense]